LTTLLVGRLGPYGLMLGAVLLFEGAALALAQVGGGEERALPQGGAAAAIGRVFASPYLAAIAGYLLLYTVTGTAIYLTQEEIVARAVKERADQVALFARIDLWVNLLSLAAQLVATRRLLQIAGVTATLVVLPAITLLGLASVGIWPILSVIVAVQVVRRTADYAAARPAREVLFTAAGPEDKYKAKSFIDTFVYRGGDALGGAVFDGLARLVGTMSVVLALIPVAIGWAAVALVLGRMEGERARGGSEPTAKSQP
jgi:AAA family ATP:ADP antiporter